jgi:hypothetical protein
LRIKSVQSRAVWAWIAAAGIFLFSILWILELYVLYVVVLFPVTIVVSISACFIGLVLGLRFRFDLRDLTILAIVRSVTMTLSFFTSSVLGFMLTSAILTVVSMLILVPVSALSITKVRQFDLLMKVLFVLAVAICDLFVASVLEPLVPR